MVRIGKQAKSSLQRNTEKTRWVGRVFLTKTKLRLNMARNDRLNFLSRQNAGRKLLPGLRERLSAALHKPKDQLNFLSLQESDTIRDQALKAFTSRDELERMGGSQSFVSGRLDETTLARGLLPNCPNPVFVILPNAEKVGVLRISGDLLNQSWSTLLAEQPDGLVVVDEIFHNQLVIELDTERRGQGNECMFAAWGDEWVPALSRIKNDHLDEGFDSENI